MWPGFPDQEPDRLLFPSAAGTPLDPKNVVDRVFKKALNRAGLRSLRWHDLRHTYASLQFESGANIKYLSMQMGHASVQITLDRYSHLLQDRHPAQAAKLSSLVLDRAEQADGCKPVAANVGDGSTDAGGNPPRGQSGQSGADSATILQPGQSETPRNLVEKWLKPRMNVSS